MKAWKKISILTVTLCLYIVLGGVLFIHLEEEQSREAQVQFIDFVQNFLANNSECGLNIDATRQLIQEIETATTDRVSSIVYGSPAGVAKEVWSLQNAVVLCFTIVTTMGELNFFQVFSSKKVNTKMLFHFLSLTHGSFVAKRIIASDSSSGR